MFAKGFKLIAIAALAATATLPAAAEARDWGHGGNRWEHRGDHDRGGRHYRGGGHGDWGRHGYYRNGYRHGGHYSGGYGRGYYGRGGYYRGGCRDSGTGGTIIGAIAGGLLGHEIGNGRYDRGNGTTGAIIGAGVGALAGRAIDRDC